MNDQPERIGPHDLGGLRGRSIDQSEHDYTFWERRVDPMKELAGLITRDSMIGTALAGSP